MLFQKMWGLRKFIELNDTYTQRRPKAATENESVILEIINNCYSVNGYKPLQNQLLHKTLQTVTNRYKPLQTSYSVNRYKSVTP